MSEFERWFPSKVCRPSEPMLNVLCIHHAGGAESVFTGKGNRLRPYNNPFIVWAEEKKKVAVYAAQLPGRLARWKEDRLVSVHAVAEKLISVCEEQQVLFSDNRIPYVIVAHSAGCWVTFELLNLLRQGGLPLPRHVFLSCFVSPDTSEDQRPWTRSRDLSVEKFKKECMGWNINKEAFARDMWEIYEPILRADFQLFDEYEFQHFDLFQNPFDVTKASLWYATKDERVTKKLMEGWCSFFKHAELKALEGTHAFPYEEEPRCTWMNEIVSTLELLLV